VPAKNLLGIPWRVAFALQDDGWTLRNAVIWHKPNAMPESVTDRLSTRYEHVFLLSKSRRYWFDLDAIREPHPRK
jgi:DNA modification methylase